MALRLLSGAVAVAYLHGYIGAVGGGDPFARSRLLRCFATSGAMMVAFAHLWHCSHDAIERGRGYVLGSAHPLAARLPARACCKRAASTCLASAFIAMSIAFVICYPNLELGDAAAIRVAQECQRTNCTDLG